MYSPELFRERDETRLHDLIEAHPFGTLVVPRDDGGVEIAHVPMLLDRGEGPHGRLRLHVARANGVWRAAVAGRPLTAVFHGPDAYVSAAWYESPHEQVPTWNYAVVHGHGRAAGPMPKDDLRRLLVDLSDVHEERGDGRWRIGALDPAFADELLAEIVGLSVGIERLEGKFKLSQNRSEEDRARVRRALRSRGNPDDVEMLRWMG